jgi:diaminohydroxyphosphoribosylaminopyrimidine deaminase/5-amino-6-(5-phosphoribosylamino)uracil reductase
MQNHETYMLRCIELAKKGMGNVAPNPLVGCVIVDNDVIISEGFHSAFGNEHAEPNAIKKVDDALLKKSTLYVNLEPCSHFGKTPPCADLIISKGIKKVVVGNLDVNPLVAGNGIKKLQEAGIEVVHGILSEACKDLNKRFFTFHEKKRPYVILKWAQTNDGFMSKMPLPANTSENWITGLESKTLVHQWRTEEQAILVGHNTVVADNPQLTARLHEGNNPIRIVIDRSLDLDLHYNVFDNKAKTLIFNSIKNETIKNLHWIKIDFTHFMDELLHQLYQLNINSVIVEGGARTLDHFINTGLWDEARIFINPNLNFENGIEAPMIDFENESHQSIGHDKLFIIKNKLA